ncbi:MAG: tetratricopeptide repeat protein [bacterium]
MNFPVKLSGLRPLAVLGRGGTAEVVRVASEKHGRHLAMKYPRADTGHSESVFSGLVAREYKLVGQLNYPGLVRVLDVSTVSPPYLLMELCSGPSLDQCGRLEDLPPALNLLAAIAVDLEFLRLNGIIHGDLKPHNIFLPPNWQNQNRRSLFYVKLSDFSLGRFSDEPDDARAGLGTVGYMAPETIVEGRTSFQSDLFALGVIAYQLLTGRHPFMDNDSDPVRTSSRVQEHQPPPLNTIRPEVPRRLADLVSQLLAKKDTDRLQSGWEVCQLLRQAGADYPFEKALRPGHFISSGCDRTAAVRPLLIVDDRQREQLDRLCNGRDDTLRLILTANFIRGNLQYTGDGFAFGGRIYWPACLRRRLLNDFSRRSFGTRKRLLKAAILNDTAVCRNPGLVENEELNNIPPLLPVLLRPLISARLVRKYSAGLGPRAESSRMSELAARLYLQAGDWEGLERCACRAARELQGQGRGEEALFLINWAVEYAGMTDRDAKTRHLMMLKGDIHKQNGDTAPAEQSYLRIIELSQSLLPDQLLGETYKDLGDLYRIKQDCPAGRRALNKALEVYRRLGDELEISHTLNNLGNICWMAGDLNAAIRHYRRALKLQRQLDAVADIASTLSNIGSVYTIQGRYRRAGRMMRLSLELKTEIGNDGEIARSLNNLGYIYRLNGQGEEALSMLEKSLQINRRIDSKKEILYNLENLTAVMITAGQLRKSLGYLKEGMALAESLDDRPHLGVFNLSMGTVLSRMGRFSDAAERLAAVGTIVEEKADRLLGVLLGIQQAALRSTIGDNEQARRMVRQALTDARETGDKSGQLGALLLLTKLSHDTDLVDQARSLVSQLRLKRESTLAGFSLIECLLDRDQADTADTIAEVPLLELQEITEDIELAWMCNVAARLMLVRRRPDIAREYLSRARMTANNKGLLPEMMNAWLLQGQIDIADGDYEQGFASYRNALRLCRKMGSAIADTADRDLFENKPEIVFLIAEVKRLASLLGQKETAGR